jgi:hypothetical protein
MQTQMQTQTQTQMQMQIRSQARDTFWLQKSEFTSETLVFAVVSPSRLELTGTAASVTHGPTPGPVACCW